MADVAHAHEHHAAPPAPTGWHRLTAPGWLRVLWVTPVGFGLGIGIPVLLRWLAHWDPVVLEQPIKIRPAVDRCVAGEPPTTEQ